MEDLKPIVTVFQQRNSKLDEATSQLEKVNHKPTVDEKYDDIMERFKQLETRFTDKEKQVFHTE